MVLNIETRDHQEDSKDYCGNGKGNHATTKKHAQKFSCGQQVWHI